MKNKFFVGLLGVMLVFVMAFAACLSEVDPDQPDVVENAARPVITAQPQSASYPLNTVIAPLTVTVSSPSDKGTLSYQWYSNTTQSNTGGTQIANATSASYTPALSTSTASTSYYFVTITNYNKNATNSQNSTIRSNVVVINVYDPAVSAEPPQITQHPQGGDHYTGSQVTLSVVAAVTQGTLSYQWFSNSEDSNSGGSLINGAKADTYSFTPNANGTFFYYVEVTNTNLGNTATVASDAAEIKVVENPFNTLTPNITLTINTNTKYQHIRGYGGMSNVEFRLGNGSPSPDMVVGDVTKVFSKEPIVWNATEGVVSGGLGLNIMRTIMYDDIDGSVNNGTLFGPGPSGGNPPQPTGWVRDNKDYYDLIKEVNKLGGYVIMAPWTFPLTYKTTGATGIGSSGSINTANFPALAQYFKSYIDNLASKGAPIFAVSIQNEPNQGVGYEGCRWDGNANNERDFIRLLGPVLANTKGYGGGREWDKVWIGPGEEAGAAGTSQHNVVNDTGTSGASQWVEFVPRHFYNAMQTRNSTAINAGKETWQTEHTDTTGAGRDSQYPSMSNWNWTWHVANEVYCSTALNDESAYVFWYIKRFYGFLGDSSQGTTWSAILPRGLVMSHFSKYAADTRRVQVTASGTFISNLGTAAGTSPGNTTETAVSSSTLNRTSFASGNNDQGGQNEPTTKIMAFQYPSDAASINDIESIVVIAYTPTQNDGTRGQDAGYVRINLPSGFNAGSAELMRSNADVRHKMEPVPMNSDGSAAIIQLPRSNIVSIKFTR